LKPDFKTIADFRNDNRGAFRGVFREFVKNICAEVRLTALVYNLRWALTILGINRLMAAVAG
jgi:hypothetical protein